MTVVPGHLGQGVTPQAVVLTMLGRFCLPSNPALSTLGYIDVLERIGLTSRAARLTVGRMTERGYLDRVRVGREAYFRASQFGLDIVAVQDRHTFEHTKASTKDPDAWTILSFSVPESRRRERHVLRRRLAWEGFGLLRDGMWIAPGKVDLEALLDPELLGDLRDCVDGFTAYPSFGDVGTMISRTWQLDELSERYEQFLDDWQVPSDVHAYTDALGRYLLLVTAWRQLVRATPRLPVAHLPEHWPAARCLELFSALHEECRRDARKLFDEIRNRYALTS